MNIPSYKEQNFAVFCLLYTAAMWGLIWYPLRYFSELGMNGLWSTFFIYSGTLVAFIPLLRKRLPELKQQPWLLSGILISSGITNTAFILAMIDGQVVRVLLLFYLSPVWAILLGRLVLHEKITLLNMAAVLTGLLGVVIMLWDEKVGNPVPASHSDWAALIAGIAFASTNVITRKANNISVPVKAVISWSGVIIVSALSIIALDSPLNITGVYTIYTAFALGAIFVVTMTLALVYGVTNLPVQRSAIILLSEVVVGAVSAYLLANEIMTLREWFGGILVMITAIVVAREDRNGRPSQNN